MSNFFFHESLRLFTHNKHSDFEVNFNNSMLCSGYNKLRLLVNAVEIKVGDRSTVIKSTNILLLVKLVIITHNGGFHGALL